MTKEQIMEKMEGMVQRYKNQDQSRKELVELGRLIMDWDCKEIGDDK